MCVVYVFRGFCCVSGLSWFCVVGCRDCFGLCCSEVFLVLCCAVLFRFVVDAFGGFCVGVFCFCVASVLVLFVVLAC